MTEQDPSSRTGRHLRRVRILPPPTTAELRAEHPRTGAERLRPLRMTDLTPIHDHERARHHG
jgi:hypothetical protein